STGKEQRGIVPICDEPLGPPAVYGDDRLFVSLAPAGRPDPHAAELDALAAAGHPVVQLPFEDRFDLGSEFFRWQMATAVAGSILGINAFDQPNVAESKRNTLEVLARDTPATPPAAAGEVRALLSDARPGDYVALLAYMPPWRDNERRLTAIR